MRSTTSMENKASIVVGLATFIVKSGLDTIVNPKGVPTTSIFFVGLIEKYMSLYGTTGTEYFFFD